MSLYDFASGAMGQIPDEDELALELAQRQDEAYDPGFIGRLLEGASPGLLGAARGFRPRNFGQGLASGFVTGLGTAGGRVAQERATIQERMAQRQALLDADRLAQSRERRAEARTYREQEHEAGLRRPSATELGPFGRYVTPQGVRTMRAQEAEAQGFKLEEKPETPAERRAQSAADRAAIAADRQATVAQSNIEAKLADDYRVDPSITAYRTAQQNLAVMEKAVKERTGFGDLALIVSYVRAIEPGVLSVVREEERRNVQEAVGRFRQYVNIPNEWVSGQRLTDVGRKEILRAGRSIATSQKPAYEASRAIFKQRATRAGVPEDIFQEYGAEIGTTRPSAVQSVSAPPTRPSASSSVPDSAGAVPKYERVNGKLVKVR